MKKYKGFTLAEMLIVVAIIGVLISILVPSFTTQLEKARETADAANIRSLMAETMSEALTECTDQEAETDLEQNEKGWQYIFKITNYDTTTTSGLKDVDKDKIIKVKCSATGSYSFEIVD